MKERQDGGNLCNAYNLLYLPPSRLKAGSRSRSELASSATGKKDDSLRNSRRIREQPGPNLHQLSFVDRPRNYGLSMSVRRE